MEAKLVNTSSSFRAILRFIFARRRGCLLPSPTLETVRQEPHYFVIILQYLLLPGRLMAPERTARVRSQNKDPKNNGQLSS